MALTPSILVTYSEVIWCSIVPDYSPQEGQRSASYPRRCIADAMTTYKADAMTTYDADAMTTYKAGIRVSYEQCTFISHVLGR